MPGRTVLLDRLTRAAARQAATSSPSGGCSASSTGSLSTGHGERRRRAARPCPLTANAAGVRPASTPSRCRSARSRKCWPTPSSVPAIVSATSRGGQPSIPSDQRQRGLDAEDRVGAELGEPGVEQVGRSWSRWRPAPDRVIRSLLVEAAASSTASARRARSRWVAITRSSAARDTSSKRPAPGSGPAGGPRSGCPARYAVQNSSASVPIVSVTLLLLSPRVRAPSRSADASPPCGSCRSPSSGSRRPPSRSAGSCSERVSRWRTRAPRRRRAGPRPRPSA